MGSAEPLVQSCHTQFNFSSAPSYRLYSLTDAVPEGTPPSAPHMQISNQSLLPGELGLDSTPEGTVTGFLRDQTEGTFTYIRDLGSPENSPHRSLVCAMQQYTVWHQMRDSVRISRVFNRKTPAVAKGRAPRTPPPCCLC